MICTRDLAQHENLNEFVYACFQIDLLYDLKTNYSNNCVYIDINIARQCPFTMAYMRVNYLNDTISIYVHHENNNMEEENEKVTSVFRKVLNKSDISVLKVKYISTSAGIKKRNFNGSIALVDDIEPSDDEDEDHDDEIKLEMYNQMKFVVFENRTIFVRDIFESTFTNRLALFEHILNYLLKHFYPEMKKNEEEISMACRQGVKEIASFFNKRFWQPTANASAEPTKYKLSDMLFEMDDWDENDLKIDYDFQFENENESETSNATASINQTTVK